MQEIAFQRIRDQKFSERGMSLDPTGGVNPIFKKILDPPLNPTDIHNQWRMKVKVKVKVHVSSYAINFILEWGLLLMNKVTENPELRDICFQWSTVDLQ